MRLRRARLCQFLRDSQFPFRTYRHQSQASIQPGITPLTGNSAGSPRARSCQTRCRRSVYRCNEHERVGTCRNCAFTLVDHAELQARSVLFTPSFLAFSSRYFTPSAPSPGNADDERHRRARGFHAGAMHHINRNSRMFAFQRIGNPATSASGSSPSRPDSLSCCPPANQCRSLLALRWCQKLGWYRISFLRV